MMHSVDALRLALGMARIAFESPFRRPFHATFPLPLPNEKMSLEVLAACASNSISGASRPFICFGLLFASKKLLVR